MTGANGSTPPRTGRFANARERLASRVNGAPAASTMVGDQALDDIRGQLSGIMSALANVVERPTLTDEDRAILREIDDRLASIEHRAEETRRTSAAIQSANDSRFESIEARLDDLRAAMSRTEQGVRVTTKAIPAVERVVSTPWGVVLVAMTLVFVGLSIVADGVRETAARVYSLAIEIVR